jgi:predicted amidohydrolase
VELVVAGRDVGLAPRSVGLDFQKIGDGLSVSQDVDREDGETRARAEQTAAACSAVFERGSRMAGKTGSPQHLRREIVRDAPRLGDGDRIYLGTAEAERFSPGAEPAILEVDGWRLGLAICKDTGIPEHAAATAALGIDAYVAGTVKHAHEAAVQDERARRVATVHRVWVAVASFAGSTGGGFDEAAGRSGIWAPDGAVVARAGSETGAVARATLS